MAHDAYDTQWAHSAEFRASCVAGSVALISSGTLGHAIQQRMQSAPTHSSDTTSHALNVRKAVIGKKFRAAQWAMTRL